MSRNITKNRPPDVEALRNTITAMDSVSQQACGEATAVLSLMQHALDTPAGLAAVERDLPTLLRMLDQRLNEAMFQVNSIAEEAGANHVDEVIRRRAEVKRSKGHPTLIAEEAGGLQ